MKYKITLILSLFLFTSCVINKSIHIDVHNSSDVRIDSNIKGSDLEDVSPKLDVPLLP